MSPPPLNEKLRAALDAKGPENSARLRRIVALLHAAQGGASDLRGAHVLDLGCGEGLFAIEAALHGATVLAVDGRDERMASGRALASELGLTSIHFELADVRTFDFEAHGPFDVVLMLGLLYHLDAADLFAVLERVARAARRALILETHVASSAERAASHRGVSYRGTTYREHRASDPPAARHARLLASLSDEASFWLTPDSLVRLLTELGFGTVLRCHAPLEPVEGPDRVTLLALAGPAATVRALDGTADATIDDLRRSSRSPRRLPFVPPTPGPRHHAVLDLTLVLGGWAKAHPELVLGTHEARDPAAWAMRPPDAALWRASDLDDYAGGLKRIPPVLAAWVVDEREALPELRELARWCIAAGARAAWLVEPGPESVEVITAGHEHLFTLDATLPEATGLPGLAPRVRDLVRTASFNAGPRDAP